MSTVTKPRLELKDRLGIFPLMVRQIIPQLEEQMKITTEHMDQFRQNCIEIRCKELSTTNKEFCEQFLPFLHKQNDDLRTKAMATYGNYVEAIPDTKKYVEASVRINPNYAGFASNEDRGFQPPYGEKNIDRFNAFVSMWEDYAIVFCMNIIGKGRINQVEEFVYKTFPISPEELTQMPRRIPCMLELSGLMKYTQEQPREQKKQEKKGPDSPGSKEGETRSDPDPESDDPNVIAAGIRYHAAAVAKLCEKLGKIQNTRSPEPAHPSQRSRESRTT